MAESSEPSLCVCVCVYVRECVCVCACNVYMYIQEYKIILTGHHDQPKSNLVNHFVELVGQHVYESMALY